MAWLSDRGQNVLIWGCLIGLPSLGVLAFGFHSTLMVLLYLVATAIWVGGICLMSTTACLFNGYLHAKYLRKNITSLTAMMASIVVSAGAIFFIGDIVVMPFGSIFPDFGVSDLPGQGYYFDREDGDWRRGGNWSGVGIALALLGYFLASKVKPSTSYLEQQRSLFPTPKDLDSSSAEYARQLGLSLDIEADEAERLVEAYAEGWDAAVEQVRTRKRRMNDDPV